MELQAYSDAQRSSVEPHNYSTYRELQLRIFYYSYAKNHKSRWELVGSLLATCSEVRVWEILNCDQTCSIVLLNTSIVAKLAHNHNTTQNTTHILHNNQQNEPPPYPQRLCPLSQLVGQQRPQILAPRLPMSPLQAPGAGFVHATAGSLVWDKFLSHIKK
jgi:hypothetical protein